jgi:probable rRNA maturation factor
MGESGPRLAFAVQRIVDADGVPANATLRRYARAACERDARVTLRIVDRREGRALNRRYRVVAGEARAQRKSLAAHYAHLVIHGMLHLQGYDHERDGDAARMEAREAALLRALGYGDPYAG